MSKIVAIEGICCSGKSTLTKQLDNARLGIVKEYGEYTNGQFPGLATSQEDLVENAKFFIKLERKRYKDGLDKLASHQTLVLDRSFITCCAFDHAAFTGTELSLYETVIESMWRREKQKLIPDLVIVLEVNRSNFQKRLAASKRKLTPLLCDPDFNQAFVRYLMSAEKNWGVRVVKINTNNLDQFQVASQVLNLLL